jgi:hypothetical protein
MVFCRREQNQYEPPMNADRNGAGAGAAGS